MRSSAMSNKSPSPFRTGQLIRFKDDWFEDGPIRLILKIRNTKQTYMGIVQHYRKYTFLNPNGTVGWEKWDLFAEEMYEVVGG